MDALTQVLVVVSVCGWALGEPLGEALRRHSRYGVYAGDYDYMYAAIPLHAPVPVLRVLSPAPLAPRDRVHAPSSHHPLFARAPYDDDDDYEAASYARRYQAPQLYAAASSVAEAEEPTVLYARPNPLGGYTYHSTSHKTSSKRAPAPPPPVDDARESPYIIRIHKYRIVKER